MIKWYKKLLRSERKILQMLVTVRLGQKFSCLERRKCGELQKKPTFLTKVTEKDVKNFRAWF